MSTATISHPYAGARKALPTKKHRPAVWENMLGTVYAMNDAGQVRYFDFDWDAARAFAGVAPERDPRTSKWTADHDRYRWHNGAGSASQPRVGQTALWILR